MKFLARIKSLKTPSLKKRVEQYLKESNLHLGGAKVGIEERDGIESVVLRYPAHVDHIRTVYLGSNQPDTAYLHRLSQFVVEHKADILQAARKTTVHDFPTYKSAGFDLGLYRASNYITHIDANFFSKLKSLAKEQGLNLTKLENALKVL